MKNNMLFALALSAALAGCDPASDPIDTGTLLSQVEAETILTANDLRLVGADSETSFVGSAAIVTVNGKLFISARITLPGSGVEQKIVEEAVRVTDQLGSVFYIGQGKTGINLRDNSRVMFALNGLAEDTFRANRAADSAERIDRERARRRDQGAEALGEPALRADIVRTDLRRLRAGRLRAELDRKGKPETPAREGEPARRRRDLVVAGVPPMLPPDVIDIPAPVQVSLGEARFNSFVVVDNALNPFTTYAFEVEILPEFFLSAPLSIVFNPLEVVDIFPQPNSEGRIVAPPVAQPLGIPGGPILEGEPAVPLPGTVTIIIRSEKLTSGAIEALLDGMEEVTQVKSLNLNIL